MTVTGKLIVSLVMAAIATALISFLQDGGMGLPLLAVIIFAATAATAFTVTLPPSEAASEAQRAPTTSQTKKPAKKPAADRQQKPAAKKPAPSPSGDREQGQVKWFNVSKGFGFITRENGEEVFVHFRSIRGEGRRSLRDGQQVSFVVAQSDKGPQAEDVEPE